MFSHQTDFGNFNCYAGTEPEMEMLRDCPTYFHPSSKHVKTGVPKFDRSFSKMGVSSMTPSVRLPFYVVVCCVCGYIVKRKVCSSIYQLRMTLQVYLQN